MTTARPALAVLALALGATLAPAQPKDAPRVKEPPRTEKVDVQIRYRIRADRDERIRQYRALEKFLADLGFEDARKNDPDRESDALDPTAERFTGTIPSAKVLDVLNDVRVENILFAPNPYMYPDERDKPVPVRVTIRGGQLPAMQQAFFFQVLQHLELSGFREALGYDTRGYTQLKGTIPYKFLDRLVKDLRSEPAGWFLNDTPVDRLPRPLADRNPVRWVEVMPMAEAPLPFTPEPVLPARARMTPELRAVLNDPAIKETPVRVIVLFASPMESKLEDLRSRLSAAYGPTTKRTADGNVVKAPDGLPALTEGASLDGAAGNLASILFDRPAEVEKFAAEPGVIALRLPRQASETVAPLPAKGEPAASQDVLKASGVPAMHKLGYTGAGVKVLVVGSDFGGAEKLIGKALPPKTRVLDLTTELNSDIVPSPADPLRAGNGLAAARAVSLSAPEAELVLVRIDPGAIFQLFGMMRVARGEATFTDALRSRLSDISTKTADLTRRKEAALNEYRLAFADLADDQATKDRRERAKAQFDSVLKDQEALTKRISRFNAFHKDVVSALLGARVVVNTLEWESGYPIDAISQLSRTLEELAAPVQPGSVRRAGDPRTPPRQPLVWVQASSIAGATVWGGPFLDPNGDGTMEFAPPTAKLPPTNWSPDMNFLAHQSADGATVEELPAGVKVRFTIQWREPLDPNFPNVDLPAYPVVLRLFRQIDPTGTKIPSDEMAEVARSAGGPYPILLAKSFVVYEQIMEFTPQAAGRFALVVAKGYEPEAALPALRRNVEVYPRIVVETLATKPGEGRAVFQSYTALDAGVGVPGDSAGAVTVGVAAPGELIGGGPGVTLRMKPDLFGPDSIDAAALGLRGSGVATGFVGGIAATLVQAGAAGANPFKSAAFVPGKAAVVPDVWLKYLRPYVPPEKPFPR